MCQVEYLEQGNGSKPLSLKSSKKVLSPRRIDTRKKPYPVLSTREYSMTDHFSQEVSQEQAGSDRSEFAFSSGLSLRLPVTTDQASRSIVGGHEHALHNGYSGDRLNEYIEHVHHGRQENGRHVEELRNDRTNISAISTPARHPDYVEYSDRLRTYARWTHRRPDPPSLAGAGFFFTNDADLVRCYQCGIGLKDFCEEDDPLKEHVRHSGNCPYLQQHLGAAQLAELKRQLQTEDPEYNRQMQWNARHTLDPTTTNYRHPEYQTLQSRLSSFRSWPQHMIQTPQQLADAGLFYTGFEDRVRCFACDGGLQRWDPDDDPWTEHCRWFPACPFARQQKGDEYIAVIQAAVAYENQGNGTQSGDRGLSGAMEQMVLREPEFRAALNEHRETCVEMGYQLEDFNEAVQELRNRGTIKPAIEEVIDAIEVIKARRIQEEALQAIQNETPAEENQRLKKFIICMKCRRNNVNILFLPCTHHRMCMECADPLTRCPVCDKIIRQKIRTYLA
ncbi:death-associated inhibitor of apoptosis 1-like [Mercenaria mercenaria]|uniref:death-associated inhibitor of apoptosis 1-like n=1 Tax=Mercenaria mercenaria TaxID=6596 RepID=UPI00234ED763|nr:death-associated inhibitor of apoptosis 1-like [Mercenaria mercenaria]XP_053396580.1 death-associated inhibitor of apoptosis 1-like [Mercenaria mercenaria]